MQPHTLLQDDWVHNHSSQHQVDPDLEEFKVSWSEIEKLKDLEDPETPNISLSLLLIKWVDPFKDHLQQCIRGRYIQLLYVLWQDFLVDPICPPLETEQPYSEDHFSIKEDMIACASHTSGLCKSNNAAMYYKLEQATRRTIYVASIVSFQRKKDGQVVFLYFFPVFWDWQVGPWVEKEGCSDPHTQVKGSDQL